jgi:sulfatase maturation enzyme AslB (radical SAM superfamily)
MKGRSFTEEIRTLPRRLSWWLRMRFDRYRDGLGRRFPVFERPPDIETPASEVVSLEGRFCANPFRQVDLEPNGTAFACCSSWLPTPMGNLKNQSLMAMWNGHAMQKIRESIYDGSFRYCRHDRCPVIRNGMLPTIEEAGRDPHFGAAVQARRTVLETPPRFLNMVNDRSCNLFCPSCRTGRIIHTEGPEYEKAAKFQKRLLEPYLSEPNEQEFTLSITGSGDPFASRVYRELLYTLDGSQYPNMRIALQTNGVLLTPRNWERMAKIHDNISSIIISFDAATEETYDVTRRGGHWSTLLENCARMGELRASGSVRHLRYDFVVQRDNYREMAAFVELARKLGGDTAYFSKMLDWGTWPHFEYLERCPWEPGHPRHDDFLEVLRDPVFDDPFVDLGNVSGLRELALRT